MFLHPRFFRIGPAVLAGALAFSLPAVAGDWPQFRGPRRDGICAVGELAAQWPVDGPPVLWREKVGAGFSGPVVAGGRVFLFSREGDEEVLTARESATGKVIWRAATPTTYQDDFGFDPGPRATPCVAEGKVFTLGADGVVQAWAAADGRVLWRFDSRRELGAAKGFFGFACSPLVESGAVLVNLGGREGAGIVAFATDTGKILWRTGGEEASYSAPVAVTWQGQRNVLFLTRHHFTALEPATGRVRFEYAFGPTERSSVTAASPVVVDDLVFLSGCYGAGATVVRVPAEGPPVKLWADATALQNHYATSVYHDGFLYGIDGRTDPGSFPGPNLRCVELRTGKVRWHDETVGAANVTLVGGELLILTEKGELFRAPASPEGFKPGARTQILGVQARAHPAIADGRLYARSQDRLVCVDLRAGK